MSVRGDAILTTSGDVETVVRGRARTEGPAHGASGHERRIAADQPRCEAPAPVRSKSLRKSIIVKIKTYQRTGAIVAIIGPSSKYTAEYKGKKVRPVNYAHLVEDGHVNAARQTLSSIGRTARIKRSRFMRLALTRKARAHASARPEIESSAQSVYEAGL